MGNGGGRCSIGEGLTPPDFVVGLGNSENISIGETEAADAGCKVEAGQ